MKKITVLLMAISLLVLLTASSAFALNGSELQSFRNEATAGMFGIEGDLDASDNVGDGVNVMKFPKWVLLTKFSNLLDTREKIFSESYDSSSTSPNTFIALMGSSEWFETQLNMPINFAFSWERNGSKTPLLDKEDGTLDNNILTAVSEVDGGDYDDEDIQAAPGATFNEFSNRRLNETYGMTSFNFTVGYKVSEQLAAGVNWRHDAAKTRYVNDGKVTAKVYDSTADEISETETTYKNGLAGTVLAANSEDTINLDAKYKIDDVSAVKGYLTLGYRNVEDNTITYDEFTALGDNEGDINQMGNRPYEVKVDAPDSVNDYEAKLTAKDGESGLIFGLAGKYYYDALYKGKINSKLGYTYKGGSVDREVKFEYSTDGDTQEETKITKKGVHSIHTFSWLTKRSIELENLNVWLGLGWNRNSDTTTSKVKVDYVKQGGEDAPDEMDTDVDSVESTITHTWSFPIGAELKVKERWTIRVGNIHTVALATATNTNNDKVTDKTYTDVRSTSYKYGVGYTWSENLQLDVNSFLQEPAANGTTDKANIFDLATYRNLAISATLTF